MTGRKVVPIADGKKPDEPCPFCGKTSACPALTCPRVKYLEQYDDGTVAAVEFFEPEVWQK